VSFFNTININEERKEKEEEMEQEEEPRNFSKLIDAKIQEKFHTVDHSQPKEETLIVKADLLKGLDLK